MIFGLLPAAAIASSTPCTAVNPDCTEWIMPAGQPSRLLIYATIHWTRGTTTSRVPNLRNIVVAGHSAGGQFVIRYEMSNQVHDSVSIPISYVVSNAAAYPYLDDLLPTLTAVPKTVAAAAPGFQPIGPAVLPPPFVPFADAKNCVGFDHWPYGLKNRIGYASILTEDELVKQLVARPTTYLLGELDILLLGIFDTSCPAMAEGPTRLARGLAFSRYANERNVANHKAVVVPFCGHSARCIFTSDVALPFIFPN